MKSQYKDTTAVVQVIGCLLNQSSLIEDESKYFFNDADFTEEFHRVVFGAINNLQKMGAKSIDVPTIEGYLENRPSSLQTYLSNNGSDWMMSVKNSADLGNFDYYYGRMKKMTLLRSYEAIGMDLTWLYDPNEIFDLIKKKKQEDKLDSLTLGEIADAIDCKLLEVRQVYVDNSVDNTQLIGEDVDELLASLQENPSFGPPLYGPLINTITRGARYGKFYIRSAPTGVGIDLPTINRRKNLEA